MNITNKLNRKIEILNYTSLKNKLGEITYDYRFLKKINTQIIPLRNRLSDLNNESEEEISEYKFIIRKKSFDGINERSLIRFEEQTFTINYWNVDFKNNEYIEIFANKRKQQ